MSTHGYTCLCRPHPKGHFHRTRNKCKREYVLLEVALHDIAIRKIQFGLPKSGNTKVCHANGSST